MKSTKYKRRSDLKNRIMHHYIMDRYIREIEREDPLDKDTLVTFYELQKTTVY